MTHFSTVPYLNVAGWPRDDSPDELKNGRFWVFLLAHTPVRDRDGKNPTPKPIGAKIGVHHPSGSNLLVCFYCNPDRWFSLSWIAKTTLAIWTWSIDTIWLVQEYGVVSGRDRWGTCQVSLASYGGAYSVCTQSQIHRLYGVQYGDLSTTSVSSGWPSVPHTLRTEYGGTTMTYTGTEYGHLSFGSLEKK